MNGLARLSGKFRAAQAEKNLGAGAERDDRSLTRHMRSLAVQPVSYTHLDVYKRQSVIYAGQIIYYR